MAYREVTMVEIKEILRLWLSGRGNKSIARWACVDLNTVRHYVQVARECGLHEGGGAGALTEERLALVLAALHVTTAGSPRGDGWELCERHREAIATLIGNRIRLTKVRKLLLTAGNRRRLPVVVPLRRLGAGLREGQGHHPGRRLRPGGRSSSTPAGWDRWNRTRRGSAVGSRLSSSPRSRLAIASYTRSSRRGPPTPSRRARLPGNILAEYSAWSSRITRRRS